MQGHGSADAARARRVDEVARRIGMAAQHREIVEPLERRPPGIGVLRCGVGVVREHCRKRPPGTVGVTVTAADDPRHVDHSTARDTDGGRPVDLVRAVECALQQEFRLEDDQRIRSDRHEPPEARARGWCITAADVELDEMRYRRREPGLQREGPTHRTFGECVERARVRVHVHVHLCEHHPRFAPGGVCRAGLRQRDDSGVRRSGEQQAHPVRQGEVMARQLLLVPQRAGEQIARQRIVLQVDRCLSALQRGDTHGRVDRERAVHEVERLAVTPVRIGALALEPVGDRGRTPVGEVRQIHASVGREQPWQ